MKKVIAIVGPTGVGKTKLSISLAKKLNGEIINGDSMQVYKGLDIGTAKIKEEEKEGIVHHLFDICNVKDNYTIYNYQKDARRVIDDIVERGHIPIIVGGSGLYLKAALYDYHLEEEYNHDEFKDMTNEKILEEIKRHHETDTHVNNRKRLVRELNKIRNHTNFQSDIYKPLYDVTIIGLTCDRKLLYNIIDKRVDKMIQDGLVNEVKTFYEEKVTSKSLETGIGYKELYLYFKGEISLEEAIFLIKKNSRNFAKRQYTFFRRQMNVEWFNVNMNDFHDTIEKVYTYLETLDKKDEEK